MPTPCIAHCGRIPNRNSLQFTIFSVRSENLADFPQRSHTQNRWRALKKNGKPKRNIKS
jgi:hypothetical protein